MKAFSLTFFLRLQFPFKQTHSHHCFIDGGSSSKINHIYIIPLCTSLSNKYSTSVKIKLQAVWSQKSKDYFLHYILAKNQQYHTEGITHIYLYAAFTAVISVRCVT
jgi:hypothetical protein